MKKDESNFVILVEFKQKKLCNISFIHFVIYISISFFCQLNNLVVM